MIQPWRMKGLARKEMGQLKHMLRVGAVVHCLSFAASTRCFLRNTRVLLSYEGSPQSPVARYLYDEIEAQT